MKTVMGTLIVLVVLTIFQTTYAASYKDPQDFSKAFAFVPNMQSSYELARRQGKPIMLIIQSAGCRACKELRPVLAKSNEIKRLSNNFVMVNGADEKDAVAEAISPNARPLGYYPRILFLGSDGKIMKNIINRNRRDEYIYYYENEIDVIAAMNSAIDANKPIQY